MPAHVGLDIGAKSIKLVEVQKKSNELVLETWGKIANPGNIYSTEEEEIEKIVEAIKKIVNETEVNSNKVAVSLSETSAFSQVIEIPPLSPRELSTAIKFEAEQYIPIPMDKVHLDYSIIHTPPKGSENKKMKVLLVAAKKTAVNTTIKLVEKAGLAPIMMETEMLALSRITGNYYPDKSILMIDLGYKSTDISIISHGKIHFLRTVKTGGEAFTRAIAQNLRMSFSQAQQYKETYGLDKTQLEGKIFQALMPVFDVVTKGIKRSLIYFQKQSGVEKVTLGVLSGGGARMRGLPNYLTGELDLEMTVLDPFANFTENSVLEQLNAREGFSVAVGLALKQ